MKIASKNFIESTLQDVFVYKAGAFTYFFLTFLFSQVDVTTNFAFDVIYTGNKNNSNKNNISMMFK